MDSLCWGCNSQKSFNISHREKFTFLSRDAIEMYPPLFRKQAFKKDVRNMNSVHTNAQTHEVVSTHSLSRECIL